MRKTSVFLVMAVCLTVMVAAPVQVRAEKFKIGATGMIDWWKPNFMDMNNQTAAKLFGGSFNDDAGASFLVGPTIWIKLGSKWDMQGDVLIGINRNKFDYASFAADVSLWYFVTGGNLINSYLNIGESKARRYDAELYFNKRFHKFFKFYIGPRFSFNDGEGTFFRLLETNAPGGFNYGWDDYTNWYLAANVGVAFDYDVIKGLNIRVGLGLLPGFGQYELERKLLYPIPYTIFLPYDYEVGYLNFGIDANAKVSYHIQAAHIEVFAGFRWIGMSHLRITDDSSLFDLTYSDDWMNGEPDHFYGLYFGLTFNF